MFYLSSCVLKISPLRIEAQIRKALGLPDGPGAKNPPANAGDTGLVPGPGRFHVPQGNSAGVPQLLKPVCPTASAQQQQQPPQ